MGLWVPQPHSRSPSEQHAHSPLSIVKGWGVVAVRRSAGAALQPDHHSALRNEQDSKLSIGLGGAAGAVTSSSVTVGQSSVTSEVADSSTSTSTSTSTSSTTITSEKSNSQKTGDIPQPSVTRLVQEYSIPNGQAVKTTQLISGQGISGVTETMQITQTKKKRRFSSTTTTQIGKAPPVTTVTSSTKNGSRVKVTLGEGKERFKLKALPPIQFDVKALTNDFFKKAPPPGKKIEDLVDINAKIDEVKKTVDSIFKTGFFEAENEYFSKIGGIKNRFQEASKQFKKFGFKFPDFNMQAY